MSGKDVAEGNRQPQKKPAKTGKAKARYIDPPNTLREKVGYGGIEDNRISRAEEFIAKNPVDFTPHATDIMARLDAVLAEARAGKIKGQEATDKISRPIMELKANGGMFQYVLISEIADIVLNFLENIDEMNEDVFEIIDAHQNTLSVIVTNKLKGSGGTEGRALAKELYQACNRYYRKHGVRLKG